jgi:hypothetical protein
MKEHVVRAEIPYTDGDGVARAITEATTLQLHLMTHTQSVHLRNSRGPQK